jgi:hypothetical protein
VLRILLVLTLVGAPGASVAHASTPFPASVPPTTDEITTDSANPFLPEERDLTDCLGLLQRPGCGSEARGGVGQTLVAILMVGGLVLIFGRVGWGVYRNRRSSDTSDTPSTS